MARGAREPQGLARPRSGASMCWRRARCAGRCLRPGSPKRCRLRGTRRGVPVFKRTRTCADLVDRRGAGLRGFSSAVRPGALPCGSSSCDQPGCVPCGRTSGVSPLCRSTKSLHRRPTVGVFYAARSSLAEVSVPDGTESMNRVNVSSKGHGGRQAAERVGRNVFAPQSCHATLGARRADASLRENFTQAG